MERTPEPDLMIEPDQAAAYAAADWSESHGKIPGYFRERFPEFIRGRVIDLGCGPADVTLRFARAYPEVTLLGVDGSQAMLELGRRRVRESGLEARIRLENRYLPEPVLETRAFDAVISNSLLHHVEDPIVLWQFASRCARPGAPIFLVDLLRPPDHDTARRLVLEHAQDAPPVLQRDFLASLHAAYTIAELRQQLSRAGLNGLRIDQVDDFHFVGWGYDDQ
jgi:SAM-dependent methyltransferase